jgi:hypothetical protein
LNGAQDRLGVGPHDFLGDRPRLGERSAGRLRHGRDVRIGRVPGAKKMRGRCPVSLDAPEVRPSVGNGVTRCLNGRGGRAVGLRQFGEEIFTAARRRLGCRLTRCEGEKQAT